MPHNESKAHDEYFNWEYKPEADVAANALAAFLASEAARWAFGMEVVKKYTHEHSSK